jgi:hypothetical protein
MYDIDGEDIEGDVMGDVMGDDDVDGDEAVVGAVVRNRRTGRKRVVRSSGAGSRAIALPPKPNWRGGQVAPGVMRPDEGMVPLPLAPHTNNGVFTASINQITFEGTLQKPFRPERLLTSTVRTGSSATGRLLGVLYVGTDLQQAEIAGWDIELLGQPTSFGTRLTCTSAQPGVSVRLVVTLSQALTTTDTIFASVNFLGRIIH